MVYPVGSTQELTITVNAPNDPHSGLRLVQYAVGTTANGDEIVRWAQARFPALHPGGVIDSAPLMRPVRVPPP